MPRAKKDAVPFSIRMDRKIHEKLESFCNHSGQNKTIAIERAVEKYINDYDEIMKKAQSSEKHA